MFATANSRGRSVMKTLASTSLALVLAAVGHASGACTQRAPTQATGPGPHDFSRAARAERLWQKGEAGEPLYLRARVLDTCGRPVSGATVKILHANKDGDHEPDRWRTHLTTDEQGSFKLLTVFPGYTGGIPRHIHFIIEHPRHWQLVTRLFFKNDPSVEHEIQDLAMVLEQVERDGGKAWLARFEFVIEPT